jgi:hypothetical protein
MLKIRAILSFIFIANLGFANAQYMLQESSSQKHLDDQPISITLTCVDNPTCEFTGGGIPIAIAIKNNLSTEIEVPMAFIQKTGPSIKLIDASSERTTWLRTNLADFKLLENLTKIKPGESASINWSISSFELQQFRHEFVDLTAQAMFRIKIRNVASNEFIDVVTRSGNTKIVSKEKPKE